MYGCEVDYRDGDYTRWDWINGWNYYQDEQSFTVNFAGAQEGRWRVWAVDASGNQTPKSPWWYFKYTV